MTTMLTEIRAAEPGMNPTNNRGDIPTAMTDINDTISTNEPTAQITPVLPSIDQMKAMADQAIKDIDNEISDLRKKSTEIAGQIRDLNAKRVDAARILGALTPRTRKPREAAAEQKPKKVSASKKAATGA